MKKNEVRIEKDSIGELAVPKEALYSIQTQRAVLNFKISNLKMPGQFIKALALIKSTAAKVNASLKLLDSDIALAIQSAAKEIINGNYHDQFPIDVFQTGSGTSSNMNANEVIANLATSHLGKKVHPNDHVNMSQSSNDVIPTAIHISAVLSIKENLLPALDHLMAAIKNKIKEIGGITKTGRTHLMDAMPVTFAQELGGWNAQIELAKERIIASLPRINELAQGGTAVGTGINAHPQFANLFARELANSTGNDFLPSRNFFASIASQDTSVEISGQLKTYAVSLMKIANDLRWMNSGPLSGLGEIELEALQPGSSIMPGKVNPVIPESVCMVVAQVIGNDSTITIAGQAGNFELNVMLPVIAYNLLQSIELLTNATLSLADKAIAGFTVNLNKIKSQLDKNPILVTALNNVIGYEKGAAIAKKAYKEKRSVLDVAAEESGLPKEELQRLLDPYILTEGGIKG